MSSTIGVKCHGAYSGSYTPLKTTSASLSSMILLHLIRLAKKDSISHCKAFSYTYRITHQLSTAPSNKFTLRILCNQTQPILGCVYICCRITIKLDHSFSRFQLDRRRFRPQIRNPLQRLHWLLFQHSIYSLTSCETFAITLLTLGNICSFTAEHRSFKMCHSVYTNSGQIGILPNDTPVTTVIDIGHSDNTPQRTHRN